MDDADDFIGRLGDHQDAITRALEYLEVREYAKAWRVLQDQEEMDSFRSLLAELKKAVPDWQMGAFQSEAAYLDFQRRSKNPT